MPTSNSRGRSDDDVAKLIRNGLRRHSSARSTIDDSGMLSRLGAAIELAAQLEERLLQHLGVQDHLDVRGRGQERRPAS